MHPRLTLRFTGVTVRPALMPPLLDRLRRDLDSLRANALYRQLRSVDSSQGPILVLDGRPVINFSSNNYLGLAHHPEVSAAAHAALLTTGTGSGASRLIAGNLAPHRSL